MPHEHTIPPASRQAGLSLTELLVAIALLGVVTGFSVSSFRTLQLDAERSAQVNRFVQSLHLARSEAMKRNAIVSLCPSRDAATCAAADTGWEAGWMLFENVDRDSPAIRDDGEPLVQVFSPWHGGRLRGNRTTLSFRSFGQAGVTATYTFCDARGSTAARAVIVSQTGRPRIAARTAAGDLLVCN
jgi:type IV fimbrial biogenesis protein FimT